MDSNHVRLRLRNTWQSEHSRNLKVELDSFRSGTSYSPLVAVHWVYVVLDLSQNEEMHSHEQYEGPEKRVISFLLSRKVNEY